MIEPAAMLRFSMRSLLLAAFLCACGASQTPSNTGHQPRPVDPTPTPTPTPDAGPPKPAAPMASEAQCHDAIDHMLELILASPDVPESAKEEWKDKEAPAREQMMRDCLVELTVPQFQCVMSKQTYAALAECK